MPVTGSENRANKILVRVHTTTPENDVRQFSQTGDAT